MKSYDIILKIFALSINLPDSTSLFRTNLCSNYYRAEIWPTRFWKFWKL